MQRTPEVVRASKSKAGVFCTEMAREGGGEGRHPQEKGGLSC